jgi:hypothetical protein
MSESKTSRVTVTLDQEKTELFKRLNAKTGQSAAQIIQLLLPQHMKDLWAYLDYLEQLPEDGSKQSKLGPFLLQSYGPETLMESVKQLDPSYKPKA